MVERQYHEEFIKYMRKILSHANYSGIPTVNNISFDASFEKLKSNWVCYGKSDTGIARTAWWNNKRIEFGIEEENGAKQMLQYHRDAIWLYERNEPEIGPTTTCYENRRVPHRITHRGSKWEVEPASTLRPQLVNPNKTRLNSEVCQHIHRAPAPLPLGAPIP